MDDQSLYNEEFREQLITLNKNIVDLTTRIDTQIKSYVAPKEEVSVSGKVEVNTEKAVEITNLETLSSALKEFSTDITKAINKNAPEKVESVSIKNAKDIRVEEVSLKQYKDFEKLFTSFVKTIIENKPIVNVEKQDIQWPKGAKNAIPVQLSDGKSFYRAIFNAVSAATGETDPLVGYQPSDIEESTTSYFGFVKANGFWYIMRQSSTGAYRYVRGGPDDENGGGLYSDAWADRANLTYDYFYKVF